MMILSSRYFFFPFRTSIKPPASFFTSIIFSIPTYPQFLPTLLLLIYIPSPSMSFRPSFLDLQRPNFTSKSGNSFTVDISYDIAISDLIYEGKHSYIYSNYSFDFFYIKLILRKGFIILLSSAILSSFYMNPTILSLFTPISFALIEALVDYFAISLFTISFPARKV